MILNVIYNIYNCSYISICLSSFPNTKQRSKDKQHTHTVTGTEIPPPMALGVQIHIHTHAQTLGHPVALQLDLPLGRSPNQTDKSLTDGSWQRDYHRDRRSVCSCGWWSLQQGDGGWERTLCTFTHLAVLSHHASVWESKSKLLQSVYPAPVHVLHVQQCAFEEDKWDAHKHCQSYFTVCEAKGWFILEIGVWKTIWPWGDVR